MLATRRATLAAQEAIAQAMERIANRLDVMSFDRLRERERVDGDRRDRPGPRGEA